VASPFLWLRRFCGFAVSMPSAFLSFYGFAVSGFMFNVQRFDDLASLS
jgi:hypothetical protein